MKILFFIESLNTGGKERRLVELIKGLKKKYLDIGIEVVLIRREISYQEIKEQEIKIHYAERKYFKKDLIVFLNFFKIAKKFKPDIIHVWGNMSAIYAIPTKILLRIPMINNEITGTPLKVNKGFLSHKLTFPFSERIIANSKAGLKTYAVSQKKSNVIYNGFNFNRLKSLDDGSIIKNKFSIKTNFIVAMVASFTYKKDYGTYLRAANGVLKQHRNITFLCIGPGDYSKYEEMVQEGFEDRIIFLGQQTNIESIMNICDIGVLTSHGEGISNALLEFMALGKPVIATNNGGTPELVDDSINGYLINHFDVESLSYRLIDLLNDNTKRKKMGVAANQKVRDVFSIDKMIFQFMNEYEKLTK